MRAKKTAATFLLALLLGLGGLPASAGSETGEMTALVEALDVKSYSKKAKAVEALAASRDPRAAAVLEALGEGLLFV